MDKLKFRRSGIQARVLALTMFFTLGASLVIAASNMHQMTAEWERTTILNAEYALQTAASAIRRDVDEIDDLAGWCAYNPGMRTYLLTGDPADMPHVEELMQQEFAGKLSICRSAPFFIETMPLGVGKDTSLEILLRAKGLTPANLMACGDGWNDLPMIRLAGMGVAMGNATDDIRKIADVTTDDNNHDGVAVAIEKYVL